MLVGSMPQTIDVVLPYSTPLPRSTSDSGRNKHVCFGLTGRRLQGKRVVAERKSERAHQSTYLVSCQFTASIDLRGGGSTTHVSAVGPAALATQAASK